MNVEVELLRHRYIQKLNDLYGSEIEHLHVLPELMGVAQSAELRGAFRYLLDKTRTHVERLDRIFAQLGIRPVTFHCRKTEALIEEAQRFPASSAALISVARRLELNEISGYLLALNCAQILWEHTAADLLEQTLKEEYEADEVLAELGLPSSRPIREKAEAGARSA